MSESIYKDDISQYMGKLKDSAPELNSKWMDYHNVVFEEGLISKKDKQLIALACAHMTSCPYCIRSRTKLAKASGATDEEIAETVFIAMRLQMGQPYAYSSIAFENFDKMKNKEDVTEGSFFSKNITPQIKDFHNLSGEKHEKFSAFHDLVYEDGHLSKKLKKGLMGLACAILAKCSWCIRSCVRDGIQEGVSKEEIAEAVNIAMVMAAGAGWAHAGITMETADNFGNKKS
ncbi:MAG: hypothetical protein FI682_01790 [SAR202 cluster bacterium]|jgi:AhpD family alkylhydroperoxidase|nr:carboxymuconolactone decarboxylase family protein [Candidatus Dadabacteria bacterium]MQF96962.1 hypothetical protein [SAR202 cluster bacterium]NSW97484.1 carboxymuconolactone decarboxylase family protein [Deltaproteobacteria bacterium TMED126]|tara:strand:+ start:968 stop:1660 length:693 start_codon:yes stop_codon:yes gene_type:complete